MKKYLLLLFVIFIIGNFNIILNLNDFFYLGSSTFSDIPITHYSNLLFIQKSILHHQQVPLWSNLIFSGYPFAANPLSGLWYFPGWIALIFPLPAGINISLLIHLLIGLIGMFFFLKSLEISNPGSILGSVAFIFSTKIYAHLGAGHLSLIYAISWTPWLLFFTQKYKYESVGHRRNIICGLFWGLILLADLRWSIPAFLIWVVLLAGKNMNFGEVLKFSSFSLGIGMLTSIASWLPLFQFLSLSSRAGLSTNEQLIFSMSLVDYLNLLFPFFEGNAETRVYPGAVIVLLSVLGIFLTQHNYRMRKWYLLALISIIFAFGENIPGVSLIFKLPGFSFIRVPSRFIFPFILALSIISAMVFDKILHGKLNYKFNRMIFIFPFLIFVVLFSLGTFLLSGEISINIIWSNIVFLVSFLILFILLTYSSRPELLTTLLLLLLAIDLFFVNYSSLRFESTTRVINYHSELVTKLTELPPNFRVYTPSYSISQEQGSYWAINQVNGVDPLQIHQYVDFFAAASGVRHEGYSVTLPAFETGSPSTDNAGKCPNKELLQALNVKMVLSAFTLSNCGLGDPKIISDQSVYEIVGEDFYISMNDCPITNINYHIKKYSPNEILLDVESCGGILQISEINYPGWQIYVDGNQILLDNQSLFRTLTVPGGRYELKMVFKPTIVFFSLFIQSFTWIACIIYLIFAGWKSNAKNHS